ncbi:DUF362 domain-containing protein [Leptolyngbya ohadii]|uniref:DUF362 domain-containing protein n=1 Tax=Leptolyngbya ohadii TaxID=1962290 RepID=UPI000B59C2A6|nr:DUF362 domain-containing protein [Leptolyngbya ohadii]
MVSGLFTQVSATADFIYEPPATAKNACRILVKPNLGYPKKPPVTVSMGVLGRVLNGLRQANPTAEILIVEGVCSPVSLPEIASRNGLYELMDDGMRLIDADTLPMQEYPNRLSRRENGEASPHPVRFPTMLAPALLQEVDCRISVGALKRTVLKEQPLISASLKNLYGLFPRSRYKARSPHSRGQLHRPSVPLVLQDVYFTIGHLFDGAVVDANEKFISVDWQPDRGSAVPVGKVIWGNDLLAVDREACRVADELTPDYVEAIEQMRNRVEK